MRRVTTQMIRNVINTFNQYHQITIHGRPHKMVLSTDNINGLGLEWMDVETHTITAQISPSSAMNHWETYLTIKTITDNQIYVEQSKLTVKRVY